MNAAAMDDRRDTLTVKGITEAIGGVQRTVQYWADEGVLQADPETEGKGKGFSRRFSPTEIAFARIAQQLHASQAPIGEVRSVIARLRSLHPRTLHDRLSEIQDRIREGDEPRLNADENQALKEWAFEAIETAALWGTESGPTYLIVVYDRVRHDAPAVRFWFADGAGSKSASVGSVFSYVDLLHAPGSAFKVIPFDAAFSEYVRDLKRRMGQDKIEALAAELIAVAKKLIVGAGLTF